MTLCLTITLLLGNAGIGFGKDHKVDCPNGTIEDIRSGESMDDYELSEKILECGHRKKKNGDIDAAIEFYKKGLKLFPNDPWAKSSLKGALQQKKFINFTKTIEPACKGTTYEKRIEAQKRCLQKYFFFYGRPIHPLIIQEFNTGLSDGGDQVVAINISNSQGSNRYCCESDPEVGMNDDGKFYAHLDFKKNGFFGYMFLGTTDNGVYFLRIWESGGGSGVFGTLLMLKVSEVSYSKSSVGRDFKKKKIPNPFSIHGKRLHLEKIGVIHLGDREKHTIDVEGNFLILNGKKIAVPRQ